MSVVVHLRNVAHRFPDGRTLRFEGELAIRAGERVAVLGANGSGKSTLLRLLAGLHEPTGGDLQVFGLLPSASFEAVRDRLGMVMQHVEDQLIAPTVFDDVAFTPRNRAWPEPEVQAAVARVMDDLGIGHLADRLTHELSGGERVRVALAGCLVARPALLLLDEPFEHLDPAARRATAALIGGLAGGGATVVLATHQMDLVPALADRIVVLAPGGRLAVVGTPREVFGRPEALRAAHVEPPVLVEVFEALQDPGLTVPLGVDEAVTALRAWRTP